ncbi:MAG: undecaprenyldiphospho-muramoylpentapeptide beta-N-acetylglucosaminyltransferase [Oligoflexia bacterium]
MSVLLRASDALFVTGGGTAGHIYAGLAIADRWRERFPSAQIVFVGARGGMEERLVPRSPHPLRLLSMGAWNGMPWHRRLRTALQIPLSFGVSVTWLLRARPAAVIGVGGYASFPLVLAAACVGWLWGCRIAVLEQNVLPGLTNRVLGKFCGRVFCAFPGAENVFGSDKVRVTGNPVRSAFEPLPSASRSPFTIFVFGGSQGAVGVNTLMIESLPSLKASGRALRVIHQTGDRDFERVAEAYKKASIDARVEKFIYDMKESYAAADLLVCRAGSSTLSEVAAVGRAAILIPLVSKDRHQVFNAEYFASQGAAEMRIQGETTGEGLAHLILELASDPARIGSIEKKVTAFFRPGAVDAIVSDLSAKGGVG